MDNFFTQPQLSGLETNLKHEVQQLREQTITSSNHCTKLVGSLDSRVRCLEEKAKSPGLTIDGRGNVITPNGFYYTNSLYAYNFQETSPLQLRDKVEHVLGANGLFVLVTRVKMFRLPNGKTAATISMESGARLDVLECWGNLAKSGSLAQYDTTLRLREDLTKAGRRRQQELNPLYDELKGKGLKPRWRNGAELFYQPNSSAKPQPYVHTTPPPPPPPPPPPAYASSGSAQQQQQQQQQQTSDTSTPQRDTHKRPTEETGTGLRQQVSGSDGRTRFRSGDDGDVGMTDQNSSSMAGAATDQSADGGGWQDVNAKGRAAQKAKSAGGTKAGGTSGAAGAAGTSSGSKVAPAKTSG
ncbi:hypothetical protein HXX76_014510 [Chlamydomonas incerta]|uniref:Uncharacterized protein n=1 Tax=Chlamydomonas incerta TaxID=51695 RepID=A0A835SJ73_CHLIN|nr:hypothetical protein HXX76_014510 [Chlamydomonas incerta]|eukprot:KAG2424458.1 hypothetical protein HXX76_014510 [Chlamydomonas incerta]